MSKVCFKINASANGGVIVNVYREPQYEPLEFAAMTMAREMKKDPMLPDQEAKESDEIKEGAYIFTWHNNAGIKSNPMKQALAFIDAVVEVQGLASGNF